MSNRAYLYSLSNRPASFLDRPETICGLSEWAYLVPFTYRVLMSGDPRLCGSLMADGLDGDTPEHKTNLYAISSEFDLGFTRLKRFFSVLREIVSDSSPQLIAGLDATETFLDCHRDRYLLLETIEIDCMSGEGEAGLLGCVQTEINECRRAGVAVDALSGTPTDATQLLRTATKQQIGFPLGALYGLRLDDDCDNTRFGMTDYPLGLEWTDVLSFELQNRSQFETTGP